MKDTQKIEAKGMKQAVIILFFMAAAGIIVSQIANSGAILIDGLFSLISAITTLIAIKVSSLLVKDHDDYPFGYAGYEILYVGLRAILLLITVLLAFADSLAKIVTYLSGGDIPQVNASLFVIYVIFIAIMYVVLFRHYSKYHKMTNGTSELLLAERFNAKANSMLMLGVGGSFGIIWLLKFTPLKFLVPIGDAIIVLFIAILVIVDAFKMLRDAVAVLGGRGISREERDELQHSLEKRLSLGIYLHKLKVQRVGKTAYVAIELQLNGSAIEKELLAHNCNLIRASIGEKYEVNQTFITIA